MSILSEGKIMNSQDNQLQQLVNDSIIAEYHCCYLCGEQLVFSYKTDGVCQKIIEQSVCKSCGFKSKPKQFNLQ